MEKTKFENEKYNQTLFWELFEIENGIDKFPQWKKDLFWDDARRLRERCAISNSPEYAIKNCLPFDKQSFLEKWWDKLDESNKKEYLIHVWLNKGSSMIFGYDWWIPFFSEVGFITNDENLVLNDDKIVLYRGSLPWLKEGMSWTTNKEFAELFASQFPESNLYTIEVNKNELLGVFYGSAGTTDDVENVAYGYEYVLNSRKIEGKTSQL